MQKQEELFVDALQAYDRYAELQERLQREMGLGFQGIARARFANPRGITASEYDTRAMHASRRVDVSEEQRPHCVLVGGEEEEKGAESDEERKKVRPAQWFGFLVPEGLRSAETHFSASLELVAQLADALIETRLKSDAFLAL
jgi:hypothetical protein